MLYLIPTSMLFVTYLAFHVAQSQILPFGVSMMLFACSAGATAASFCLLP